MSEYNSALPDADQSKVIGDPQVVANDPRWPSGAMGAGYVAEPTDEESGTKLGEVDQQNYQVPGTPHYGGDVGDTSESSKGHD